MGNTKFHYQNCNENKETFNNESTETFNSFVTTLTAQTMLTVLSIPVLEVRHDYKPMHAQSAKNVLRPNTTPYFELCFVSLPDYIS